MAFSIRNIFGDPNKKLLRKYEPIVALVNNFEPAISALTDEQLKSKTSEFKSRLEK
jgi:preprotein translocase subunit SecA